MDYCIPVCKIGKQVLSLNENSQENSSSQKKKVTKPETSAKGLILKELPSHMKYSFLEPEKWKPVIISAELNENEEQRLLHILGNTRGLLPGQLKI